MDKTACRRQITINDLSPNALNNISTYVTDIVARSQRELSEATVGIARLKLGRDISEEELVQMIEQDELRIEYETKNELPQTRTNGSVYTTMKTDIKFFKRI